MFYNLSSYKIGDDFNVILKNDYSGYNGIFRKIHDDYEVEYLISRSWWTYFFIIMLSIPWFFTFDSLISHGTPLLLDVLILIIFGVFSLPIMIIYDDNIFDILRPYILKMHFDFLFFKNKLLPNLSIIDTGDKIFIFTKYKYGYIDDIFYTKLSKSEIDMAHFKQQAEEFMVIVDYFINTNPDYNSQKSNLDIVCKYYSIKRLKQLFKNN